MGPGITATSSAQASMPAVTGVPLSNLALRMPHHGPGQLAETPAQLRQTPTRPQSSQPGSSAQQQSTSHTAAQMQSPVRYHGSDRRWQQPGSLSRPPTDDGGSMAAQQVGGNRRDSTPGTRPIAGSPGSQMPHNLHSSSVQAPVDSRVSTASAGAMRQGFSPVPSAHGHATSAYQQQVMVTAPAYTYAQGFARVWVRTGPQPPLQSITSPPPLPSLPIPLSRAGKQRSLWQNAVDKNNKR